MVCFKEYDHISLLEESRYVHYLSFLDFKTNYKKFIFTPNGLGTQFHNWKNKKEYLDMIGNNHELLLK